MKKYTILILNLIKKFYNSVMIIKVVKQCTFEQVINYRFNVTIATENSPKDSCFSRSKTLVGILIEEPSMPEVCFFFSRTWAQKSLYFTNLLVFNLKKYFQGKNIFWQNSPNFANPFADFFWYLPNFANLFQIFASL